MPRVPSNNLAHEVLVIFTNGLITPILYFFCALFIMLIIGNPLINWLQQKRWKKDATNEETWAVREDTPDTHLVKRGTPSMGGIGIVGAVLFTSLALLIFYQFIFAMAWGIANSYRIIHYLPVFAVVPFIFLAHAALGFADDWSKASGRGGLRARSKLAIQILLAAIFVAILFLLSWPPAGPGFNLLGPVEKFPTILGCGFLMFIIIAIGNAVNLTDGIDGLASGLAVQCCFVLILCGPMQGRIEPTVVFFAALAGACFGFLHFNKHKARVFMGDTGSLAIGAALGAGAILQHAVFLLPFIGFIYFVEAASVTLQVLWFKYTKAKTGEGKRLFRRAPLHHHFELCGWSEWRVVLTFWAVNLVTSAIGLWLWYAGVLPRWP